MFSRGNTSAALVSSGNTNLGLAYCDLTNVALAANNIGTMVIYNNIGALAYIGIINVDFAAWIYIDTTNADLAAWIYIGITIAALVNRGNTGAILAYYANINAVVDRGLLLCPGPGGEGKHGNHHYGQGHGPARHVHSGQRLRRPHKILMD